MTSQEEIIVQKTKKKQEVIREAFKNENAETYGIFHMWVGCVPHPPQHMENISIIFYPLKMISDSF